LGHCIWGPSRYFAEIYQNARTKAEAASGTGLPQWSFKPQTFLLTGSTPPAINSSKQMDFAEIGRYLPGINDLTVPAVVALIYWTIKRVGSPAIRWFTHLLRSSRRRDLVLAKRYRVDPFSIQRQIAKEEALFSAFIVCTVLSITLLLTVNGGSRPHSIRIVYFFLHMLPIVAVEMWWLWQKEFVSVLLEEASRIGPGFTRVIPSRKPSDARIKQREERRSRKKTDITTNKKVIRR
jgi:hypothetical protein